MFLKRSAMLSYSRMIPLLLLLLLLLLGGLGIDGARLGG